ncbi:hypothetical protein V8G54_009500 [Vigna mungo]|uniref:Uncharacterized protein n=1 Tax=Vigna mungo TaxID=3915 RepID=A0AAQ3S4X5_VIGMU
MASHEKSIYAESRTSYVGMNQLYPELVRYFWKNARVEANNTKSIVIRKTIVINFETISNAVNFPIMKASFGMHFKPLMEKLNASSMEEALRENIYATKLSIRS